MPSRGPRTTANTVGATQVIKVGGLSGQVTTLNNARNSPGKTLSVLVFANEKSYTLSSTLADDKGSGTYASDFCANSKVKLVMNGSQSGTQDIYATSAFSGGLDVLSGTIRFNVSQTSSNGYGIRADTNTTLFTHGDLYMQGGTLEFYVSANVKYAFSFNKASYEGGTLLFNVYDTGITSMSLDKLDASDTEGGYFANALGTTPTVVEIDFGSNLEMLTNGNESKIISWSGYDDSLSFHTANKIILGADYEFVYRAADDGLYVHLNSVVPEPATFAAIFGLVAIVAAMYRRRK